jgi:2-polyprenyl-3-methyl-5-hydroxy-6-metoxy-1,4-benzoquinol methylase
LKKNFENITCPVCEKQSAALYVQKNKCNFYRCKKCCLLFVSPLPSEAEKIYSENYFSGTKGSLGYADYEGDREVMAGVFETYLGKIENYFPKKGKLLDVGAATGHFVRLAGARGWEASGIEISHYAADLGRKKGLQIVTGNFEAYDAPKNYFDVVTFWDVLEHFKKPDIAIRQAQKILKIGGILAINTPDSKSILAKFFSRHWHAIIPPNHLHIFNQKNLKQLLAKNNFETIEMARVGKKFSLRFIFKVLSGWQKLEIWEKAYGQANKSHWGNWKIPLNTRDNMFIISKKNL